MKRIFTLLAAVLLTASAWAQSPEKMSYQAVIRDASDNLITNQSVGMQISILQGSASGTAVYVETQTPTTNANGLVSIEIGTGTVESGDFAAIDWATGPYFIKTETDPAGGTNYTITGTSQVLSVPYALHAKSSETITGGITETDPVFTAWDKSTGISVTESQISDFGTYIETETDPSVPPGTQTGEIQYWNGYEWITVPAGNQGNILTFVNNAPMWRPVIEDGDVLNSATGKVWMDKNLGASQVADSSTDYNAYGDLYQWGRLSDGHESITWTSSTSGTPDNGTTSTTSSSNDPGTSLFITAGSGSDYDWRDPQNDNLWQGVSGTNNPCPNGYRLPILAELNAERLSWSSNDAAGAYGSTLKFPVVGVRNYGSGLLGTVGSYGYYWSSTVDGTSARDLYFNISGAGVYGDRRAHGLSVRCIKD